MELLAFTYSAVAYEDPTPAPEWRSLQKSLQDMNLRIPSSAWMSLLAIATVVGTVNICSEQVLAAPQLGESGAEVRSLQAALMANNYYRGVITGYFGALTQQGLVAFQIARGLPATGLADEATLRELALDPGAIAPVVDEAETANPTQLVNNPIPAEPFTIPLANRSAQTASTQTSSVVTQNGMGVNVRNAPAGEVVGGKDDGAVILYDPSTATARDGFTWVRTTENVWIAQEYLSGNRVTNAPSVSTASRSSSSVNTTGFAERDARVVTLSDPLTIRSRPSVDGAGIDAIPSGTFVVYTRRARLADGTSWYYLPDYGGWASGEYLDLVS